MIETAFAFALTAIELFVFNYPYNAVISERYYVPKLPIVVVLHLGKLFAHAFAEWLASPARPLPARPRARPGQHRERLRHNYPRRRR